MTGALIPDGPLHPGTALLAAVAGVLVALIARRRPSVWVTTVLVAGGCVLVYRQGAALVDGYRARPDLVAVWCVSVGAAAAGVALRPPFRRAALATVVGCAVVWGLVPDTEAPLVAALVVAVALVASPADARSHSVGILVALPAIVAAVGSAGRPDRFPLAAGAGLAIAALCMVLRPAVRRGSIGRGQRAGIPTTVVSAATSDVTTAPAPTTAS